MQQMEKRDEKIATRCDIVKYRPPFRDMVVIKASGRKKDLIELQDKFKEMYPDEEANEVGAVKKQSKRRFFCFFLRWTDDK